MDELTYTVHRKDNGNIIVTLADKDSCVIRRFLNHEEFTTWRKSLKHQEKQPKIQYGNLRLVK